MEPNEIAEALKADVADLLGSASSDDGHVEPVEPADPIEPVEPIEPVDPAEPTEPVEPTPVGEFVMPDVMPDDPVALKALLTSVNAQMVEMRKSLTAAPVPVAPTEPVVSTPTTPAITDPVEATKMLVAAIQEGKPLLSQEELDSVVDNPALISTAINRGLEQFVSKFIEALPALTGTLVDQHTATRTVVDKFYTDNKDLVDFKPYLKTVSQEILQKNPKLSVADMLSQTAAEARKRLKLPSPNTTPAVKPVVPAVTRAAATKPAFVKQRQGAVAASVATRTSAKSGSSEKEQVADMLK